MDTADGFFRFFLSLAGNLVHGLTGSRAVGVLSAGWSCYHGSCQYSVKKGGRSSSFSFLGWTYAIVEKLKGQLPWEDRPLGTLLWKDKPVSWESKSLSWEEGSRYVMGWESASHQPLMCGRITENFLDAAGKKKKVTIKSLFF